MLDPVATTKALTAAATSATAFWDVKASEILKFVSAVLSAVAWPGAAVFIVHLFKNEIIERIPRLSELTLPGGLSAKFNQGLAQIEAVVAEGHPSPAQAAPVTPAEPAQSTENPSATPPPPTPEDPPSAPPPPRPGPKPPTSPDEYFAPPPVSTDVLALRANPTGVVMEAWKSVESTLIQLAIVSGKFSMAEIHRSPRTLMNNLFHQGLITSSELATASELFNLRNLAAHSRDRSLSEAEATRFAAAAGELLVSLQSKSFAFADRTT